MPILFIKYPFFAEKLANGVDIGERLVNLSPFYLYFLAILNKLFGVIWPFIKCFQIFIGAINTLLVFAIGSRLFKRGAAFIGVIGVLMFAAYLRARRSGTNLHRRYMRLAKLNEKYR